MTDEPYTPLSSWSEWVSIKTRFEWLLTAGHKPIAARALLTDWLESDNIEIKPPLPRVYKIRLLPDDGITIDTDGTDAGLIDPAQVLSRERPKPRDIPRVRPPMVRPPMVFRGGSLAARLTPDDIVTQDEHKIKIMEEFGISENQYITRVWPAARELAKLPRMGKAGRKPKK